MNKTRFQLRRLLGHLRGKTLQNCTVHQPTPKDLQRLVLPGENPATIVERIDVSITNILQTKDFGIGASDGFGSVHSGAL